MAVKRNLLTKTEAIEALRRAGLSLDWDYHRLSYLSVDKVLFVASLYGYRIPKNAPGSKGRMFWQFMQRVARR